MNSGSEPIPMMIVRVRSNLGSSFATSKVNIRISVQNYTLHEVTLRFGLHFIYLFIFFFGFYFFF